MPSSHARVQTAVSERVWDSAPTARAGLGVWARCDSVPSTVSLSTQGVHREGGAAVTCSWSCTQGPRGRGGAGWGGELILLLLLLLQCDLGRSLPSLASVSPFRLARSFSGKLERGKAWPLPCTGGRLSPLSAPLRSGSFTESWRDHPHPKGRSQRPSGDCLEQREPGSLHLSR